MEAFLDKMGALQGDDQEAEEGLLFPLNLDEALEVANPDSGNGDNKINLSTNCRQRLLCELRSGQVVDKEMLEKLHKYCFQVTHQNHVHMSP